MSQQAFIERAIASGRRRKLALAIVCALLALVIAGVAAGAVFIGGINSRLQIEDAALTSVLADAPEGEPVYTLLSASFDDGDGGAGPDLALLVRTDSEAASASIVVIPGNVRTTLSDDQTHRLGDAWTVGGDAEVVSAVESLADVQISHYVKTDEMGFVSLVDALGGLQVDVPEVASDPDAGTGVIASGPQLLSGAQALYLCRANDFVSLAEQQRGINEALVAEALFERFASMDKLKFYMEMDGIAGMFTTDLNLKGAFAMLSSMKALVPGSIMVGVMPTYASEFDGVQYQVPIADEWSDMLTRLKEGQVLQEDKEDVIGSVDPSSFTITVNNGGGVVGAAADATAVLEDAGFTVDSVGNAAQAVYDSTLVVYQDSEHEAAAEALVAALGTGRVVFDAVNYSFETDILVVVGKDWQNILNAKSAAQGGTSSASADASANSVEEVPTDSSATSDVSGESSATTSSNVNS